VINYEPGQRVALTHVNDPDGPLQQDQQGVVRGYDPGTHVVIVGWDDGTVTPVRLAAGDRLDVVAAPAPINEQAWQHLLATVTERGSQDGHAAIEQWTRERSELTPPQLRALARQILRDLADDDLNASPLAPRYETSAYAQPVANWQLSELLAGVDPAAWQPVPTTSWEQAVWVYRDGFETAVREHAGDWARRTLIPGAGGRDLAELRPDRVCVGRIGVFSGDWMEAASGEDPDVLRAGFVGTLIDRWNGWAAFTCTRQVAEAIVADQQQQRADEQASLQAGGMPAVDARREVDNVLADLSFDGDTIVADQRAMYDDPDAVERVTPDDDGRYVVMGRNWRWEAVDPYACDRIVGNLPAAGSEQEFVYLTHTPGMRLPHDRLRLQMVSHWPVRGGLAYVGTLTLDGRPVATVGNDAAGNGHDLVCTQPTAAEDLDAFRAGCRYQDMPVDWPRLLDALADEVYLAAAVKQSTADGETLVRAVDDAGHTLSLRPIPQRPSGWEALTSLGSQLTREGTGHWQMWTGRSWFSLPANAHHVA
jgi:hypothetical protein